jgi:hypothetical protein
VAEALAEVMTEGAFINGALIGISENRQLWEGGTGGGGVGAGNSVSLSGAAWGYHRQVSASASVIFKYPAPNVLVFYGEIRSDN